MHRLLYKYVKVTSMPIYEYHCKACGHHFELMQKVSAPVPGKCPTCNRAKVEKLVSTTSFQLKGTGWYATDCKDNKQKEADKVDDQGKSGGTEDAQAANADKKAKPATKTADPKS